MTTYIYMHICCINNWNEVVTNLFNHIRNSGLYDMVTEIRCGVLGNYQEFIDAFSDPKVVVIYASDDISLHEMVTLNLLREHSQDNDFNVLYVHSKGVTRTGQQGENVAEWVNYMCYFNMYHAKTCLQFLEDHDCVGVNINREPVLHYSGNFWWSKSSHIRKLNECVSSHYNSPEFWVTDTDVGSFVSIWKSHINHYDGGYAEENYKDKELSSIKIFVKQL